MKAIKFFAVAAMIAVSTGASAQFTNGGSSSASSSVNTDGWSTFWVEWNPSSFNYDVKNADDQSFTGLSLGYSQAFNIMQGKPLFLEAGFGVQYSFCTIDEGDDDYYYYYYYDDDDDLKFNMFSVKVPLNLIYKFDLPNSSVAIMPYVGANLRYNISAKLERGDADADLFDKKDMGSDKATWNRFQLGWNVGAKVRFGNSFLVGLGYGKDFSEIAKKTKVGTTTIAVGFLF